MATATKNVRLRNKKTNPEKEVVHDDAGVETDIFPSKNKKPIEIDEPEPIVGAVEEKIEEDPLIAAVEEEDSSEEIGLDGEELNPFGDRWEE